MTAPLRIEVLGAPLERVAADLAVVPCAYGERPLRGSAGRADWRLCGRLSALIAARRLSGARGEAVLLLTGGALRVPVLLALGVGPRGELDERACEQIATDVAERALRLRARRVVLPLPGEGADLAVELRAQAFLAGAVRALEGRDARLELVVLADAGTAWALAAVPPSPDVDLVVPEAAGRPPRGGLRPRDPATLPPQIVK